MKDWSHQCQSEGLVKLVSELRTGDTCVRCEDWSHLSSTGHTNVRVKDWSHQCQSEGLIKPVSCRVKDWRHLCQM